MEITDHQHGLPGRCPQKFPSNVNVGKPTKHMEDNQIGSHTSQGLNTNANKWNRYLKFGASNPANIPSDEACQRHNRKKERKHKDRRNPKHTYGRKEKRERARDGRKLKRGAEYITVYVGDEENGELGVRGAGGVRPDAAEVVDDDAVATGRA